MPEMQLSMFDDADVALVVAPATTAHVRRSAGSTRSTLAERIARVQAATDADTHALAVDAILNAATPRVAEIAGLFAPAWPDADVEVSDLVQEAFLDIVAALHVAPCSSDSATAAWLSSLVTKTLHTRWRLAMDDAELRRDAVAVFAVDLEPDSGAPCTDKFDDRDDVGEFNDLDVDESHGQRAA